MIITGLVRLRRNQVGHQVLLFTLLARPGAQASSADHETGSKRILPGTCAVIAKAATAQTGLWIIVIRADPNEVCQGRGRTARRDAALDIQKVGVALQRIDRLAELVGGRDDIRLGEGGPDSVAIPARHCLAIIGVTRDMGADPTIVIAANSTGQGSSRACPSTMATTYPS